MSLFVDASALVAIIAREPERDAFVAILIAEPVVLWSPMTCWETIITLARAKKFLIGEARIEADAAARYFSFALVPIAQEELDLAIHAYGKYGKGTGHPAQLNMGDCFAYACAKTNNARPLYKGDDFSRTDLA